MLLHDASPGDHAATSHLLPLPQYGTLEQGGEGNLISVWSLGNKVTLPRGWSFDYVPAESLINVYDRQKAKGTEQCRLRLNFLTGRILC